MIPIRNKIGGFGNLLFKEAFLLGKMLDGEIPDMYVQRTGYWRAHSSTVRHHFSEGIGPAINKVAVHVRRGDYLTTPDYYANLSETDYYRKALEFFPEDTFIVFCKDNQGWEQDKEDRQWCRDFFDKLIPGRYEMPPKENKEHEDFNLMASCKSIIMANSTFSWWASFLGSHEKIIAPNLWFANPDMRMELLPEWTRI